MTVVNMQIELFKAHGEEMHDVANVQIENPVVLVLHSQDGFDVVLQLNGAFFSLLKSLSIVFVYVVVSG